MKVIEHLEKAKKPLFSYEIIPPKRGSSVQDVIEVAKKLAPYEPPFIDVTAHSAEAYYEEQGDGTVKRRIHRKRPGTLGICGILQNRFKIDTVAHILCHGFTKEETEDALIELNYLGVHNVIALRGDEPNFKKEVAKHKTINLHASDLVEQIHDLKQGKFLEDMGHNSPLDFCVGVAGYPEKHFEAPNLKQDILNLKKKVDAGADYVVTQMFFDNQHYFDFVKACRDEGITVPIIPGLKIITSAGQLTSIPKNFYLNMPDELVDEITADPKNVKEIGTRWTMKQAEELLNANVPCLHFYVMNHPDCVLKIVDKLG